MTVDQHCTGNVITFFSFKTHEFRNFAVSGSPLGVFVSHDGYVYYAEFLGNKIGRLNGTTGEIKEYPLPAALFVSILPFPTLLFLRGLLLQLLAC